MGWSLDVAQKRGSAARVNQNMVVFLAADAARWAELDRSVRDYLAWSYVRANADGALGLTAAQRTQAEERRVRADQTVRDQLTGTFHWALVPQNQPMTIKLVKADGTGDDVAVRTATKLYDSDDLSLQRATNVIRLDLDGPLRSAWDKLGHITFGELWGYYTTYPYLARLRDRTVLAAGVAAVLDSELVWRDTGFALATGWDGERYVGLGVPGATAHAVEATDSLLIVQPERALAQQAADAERRADAEAGGHTPMADSDVPPTSSDAKTTSSLPGVPPPAARRLTRFYGAKKLNPERYASDFAKLAQEVVAHLAAVEGVELEVRVEITARAPDGFDEAKVRTVKENSTVLRFDDAGFEPS